MGGMRLDAIEEFDNLQLSCVPWSENRRGPYNDFGRVATVAHFCEAEEKD